MASFLRNILVLVAISTNVLALVPSRTSISTNFRSGSVAPKPVPTAGGLFGVGVGRKSTAVKAVDTDLVSSVVPTVLYTGAALLAVATQGNIESFNKNKKEESKDTAGDSTEETGETTDESTEVTPVDDGKKLGPIRGFFSLLWKIIRKILQPWKKWSEL